MLFYREILRIFFKTLRILISMYTLVLVSFNASISFGGRDSRQFRMFQFAVHGSAYLPETNIATYIPTPTEWYMFYISSQREWQQSQQRLRLCQFKLYSCDK